MTLKEYIARGQIPDKVQIRETLEFYYKKPVKGKGFKGTVIAVDRGYPVIRFHGKRMSKNWRARSAFENYDCAYYIIRPEENKASTTKVKEEDMGLWTVSISR